jgi:formate/nitrite transporter FocA (FNT family)
MELSEKVHQRDNNGRQNNNSTNSGSITNNANATSKSIDKPSSSPGIRPKLAKKAYDPENPEDPHRESKSPDNVKSLSQTKEMEEGLPNDVIEVEVRKAFRTPRQTAARLGEIAVEKHRVPKFRAFLMSIYGGAYIAIAQMLVLKMTFSVDTVFGTLTPANRVVLTGAVAPWLAGLVFPIGFIAISVVGGDLFATNSFYFGVAMLERKVGVLQSISRIVISWIGNFVGCALVAIFMTYLTQPFGADPQAFLEEQLAIRVLVGWGIAFFRGVGAMALLSFATTMAAASTEVVSKIAGVYLPAVAFTALRYELAIVNMYLIILHLLYASSDPHLGRLVYQNLIASSIGNIVGAMVAYALPYTFIYLTGRKAASSAT